MFSSDLSCLCDLLQRMRAPAPLDFPAGFRRVSPRRPARYFAIVNFLATAARGYNRVQRLQCNRGQRLQCTAIAIT